MALESLLSISAVSMRLFAITAPETGSGLGAIVSDAFLEMDSHTRGSAVLMLDWSVACPVSPRFPRVPRP